MIPFAVLTFHPDKPNEVTVKTRVMGEDVEMTLPVSAERVRKYLNGEGPRFVQDAFPDLDAGQREFLISGTTPQRWNEIFGGGQFDD